MSSLQLLPAGPVAQTPLPLFLGEKVSNFLSGRPVLGLSSAAGDFCVIADNVKLQPGGTGILNV